MSRIDWAQRETTEERESSTRQILCVRKREGQRERERQTENLEHATFLGFHTRVWCLFAQFLPRLLFCQYILYSNKNRQRGPRTWICLKSDSRSWLWKTGTYFTHFKMLFGLSSGQIWIWKYLIDVEWHQKIVQSPLRRQSRVREWPQIARDRFAVIPGPWGSRAT